MAYLILTVVIVSITVFLLQKKSAYYGKVFTDEHYTEVGNWLHSVLKLGAVEVPRLEDKTVFESSGGCGFTFTREIGDTDRIHIAISQVGTATVHAVASRLTFLILQILKSNKAEAYFYYTESRVHHLLFERSVGEEWAVNDVDTAVASMQSYESVPFEFESMGRDGHDNLAGPQ